MHNKNGVWEKSIVEFIPTDENYYKLVNQLTEQFQGTVKLLYQTTGVTVTCTTITIITYTCPGNCMPGGGCDAREGAYCTSCATYQSLTFCTTDENGNNGGANDGGVYDGGTNNGGTYTGGGNDGTGTGTSPNTPTNPDAIPISPNFEHLNLDSGVPPPTEPCQQLIDLVDPARGNGSVKSNVDILKQKVNSNNNKSEIGFETQKINLDGNYSYANTNVSVGNQYSVPITTGNNYIGGGHNHPVDGHPMFSFGDVKLLRDIYEAASPSRKPEVFYIVVCKNQATGDIKTYSLKVGNFDALTNAVDAVWNDPRYAAFSELNNARIDKIHEVQGKKYDQCGGDYEKSFLQQFGAFGISLYQAANENLTSWSKLELTPAAGSLIVNRIPCN